MRHGRAWKEEKLLAEAQAVIKEYLDWEEKASAPNLTEIEEVVLKLRQRFGQEMAEVAIADQDAKQPAEVPQCPQCDGAMRYKGQKGIDADSRLGVLDIGRGYYYCARCESGLFPPG